jgi:hypothetical protein
MDKACNQAGIGSEEAHDGTGFARWQQGADNGGGLQVHPPTLGDRGGADHHVKNG